MILFSNSKSKVIQYKGETNLVYRLLINLTIQHKLVGNNINCYIQKYIGIRITIIMNKHS